VAAGGGAAGALFGGILTPVPVVALDPLRQRPIGIVLFLFARLYLVESRADGPRRQLDLAGSVTVTGGLLALVYTIVHTDQVSWTSHSTLLTGTICRDPAGRLRDHRGHAGHPSAGARSGCSGRGHSPRPTW